jgi:hypothetical protein
MRQTFLVSTWQPHGRHKFGTAVKPPRPWQRQSSGSHMAATSTVCRSGAYNFHLLITCLSSFRVPSLLPFLHSPNFFHPKRRPNLRSVCQQPIWRQVLQHRLKKFKLLTEILQKTPNYQQQSHQLHRIQRPQPNHQKPCAPFAFLSSLDWKEVPSRLQ